MYIASGTYNWADEMDIPYVIILTDVQYKNYLKFREKFPDFVTFHICCGTNQDTDINVNDFEFQEICTEYLKVIRKYIPTWELELDLLEKIEEYVEREYEGFSDILLPCTLFDLPEDLFARYLDLIIEYDKERDELRIDDYGKR
jgi:hypothetical protein